MEHRLFSLLIAQNPMFAPSKLPSTLNSSGYLEESDIGEGIEGSWVNYGRVVDGSERMEGKWSEACGSMEKNVGRSSTKSAHFRR